MTARGTCIRSNDEWVYCSDVFRLPAPIERANRGGSSARRRAAAWSAIVVLTASCGGGPGADAFRPSQAPDDSGLAPQDTPATDVSPLDRVFGTDTTEVRVASEPPVVPTTLSAQPCNDASTENRAAADPFRESKLIGAAITAEPGSCGPRVVIEFDKAGGLPTWGVGYFDDPITDSLIVRDVSLTGEATLLLNLGTWMGVFGIGYTGPTDILVDDVRGLRELRLVANNDGFSTWAIGVDAEVPFTVTEETNPPRIVVQFVPLG